MKTSFPLTPVRLTQKVVKSRDPQPILVEKQCLEAKRETTLKYFEKDMLYSKGDKHFTQVFYVLERNGFGDLQWMEPKKSLVKFYDVRFSSNADSELHILRHLQQNCTSLNLQPNSFLDIVDSCELHLANQVFSRVNIIDFTPGYYSLSEVVGLDGPLNELNAISVYRQVMEILSFVHSTGISLRNVCMDTIMITHNTDQNVLGLCKNPVVDPTIHVKIFDLESATYSPSKLVPVTQFFNAHTQRQFVPPEVYTLQSLQILNNNTNTTVSGCEQQNVVCYDSFAGDVWSSGVVLFSLLLGAVPFDNAHYFGCRRYRLFSDSGLRLFLSAYCENMRRMDVEYTHFTLSESAVGLLEGVLERDCLKRYTVQQVLSCEWLKVAAVTVEAEVMVAE